ncbi:gliding motility-associated C-terminal domain-containing protein [Panacibacter ginsenosidivorans]|uniref:Gliding motility-associated C-terminal domain-containing protein n=1 Tax=Panacibacter ginsenosidivorans TaxID=1813871 RepID=A0A5B8VBS0_9BACT|nr:gliding motility-associated C-terminal domain-containing protein [Panacibacter ginsenosidivorans]QEC68475.1 gliding motility-associated C-terminal domain-containing protein [Panacibacter ginsenosidivorans]
MKYSILFAGLLFCFAIKATAQLCNGNLGDPILNMTFGAKGFVMPKNTTTFEQAGGCPNKGQFVISSFLFGCGSNNDHSWIKMIGDHTRDLDGNYMLINAESTPGTIYTDTAKDLCDNTNYVFTAWVSNAMQNFTCGGNPVLANLTFTVKKLDGTVLSTSSTGDIPVADDRIWKQYGLAFTTPANTPEVIVSITTNPTYGCGSGFVIDDITFRSCGPLVTVTLDGATDGGNVCADYTNPFILQGTYSAYYNDPAVQWQSSVDTGKTWQDIPGETTTTYAIPRRMTGVINYRMVVAERANINSLNCRTASNDIYTEIHPVPLHNPPQNILGCLDKNLILPATDPSALQILWKGPNNYSYSLADPLAVVPSIKYADTGLYTLKQNFYFGCTTFDSFFLKIYPSTTISAIPPHPVCEGASQQLSVSSSGGGTYQWYPSTGLSNDAIPNPIARPTDSTEYKVVVTNSFGCKDSAYLTINVYRNLELNAGIDKVILAGDTATLDATIKGTAIDFTWSPPTAISDVHAIRPKVFPIEGTEYTVSATSTVGCGSGMDKVLVTVYKGIKIPNAFTPNGDGNNDKFRVLPLDNYKLVQLIIYNRWGKLLFRTNDKYNGWDGTFNGMVQPPGTYVYHLELVSDQNKRLVKQGTVLLLR